MRITGIELKNWMIHRHLDIEVKPLTIIAGPNESGKTSIADAVDFVVYNGLPRVSTKGERELLISEGAQKGAVTIRAGDAIVKRDVATGKLSSSVMMPIREGAVPQAMPFLLHPELFGQSSTDDRRTLLSKVMKVDLSPDGLLATMKERGAAPYVITGLPANADLDKWRAVAKESASQGRGAWKQITGETYGAQKAIAWEADAPAPIAGTLAEFDAKLKAARAAMTAASDRVAARNAYIQATADYEERRAKLRPKAAKLGDAIVAEMAAKEDVEKAMAEVTRQRALNLQSSETTPCPSCGSILCLTENGDLEEVVQTASAGEIAAQAKLRDAQEALRNASLELASIRTAEETLRFLEKPVAQVDANEDLQQAADDASDAFDAATSARAAFIANQDAIAKAKKATENAKAAHEKVGAWLAAEAWLAPDGIPGELLGKALQPFNATMARLAGRAGWKVVTLSENMSISVGGRSYGLHSESGRWRADVIIALALAVHSNLRIATVDRFDVLEPAARKPAIVFFRGLTREEAAEIDTLLVLGTFKEPPGAPPDVAVVWLGETSEASVRAA